MNKNTDTLDKRLQMYVTNMAIDAMPFGREWDSSAKNLEDQLQIRGIKLPQKLYYEYKMPHGDTQGTFMNKIIMEYFCTYFFKPCGYAGKILTDKNLTMKDKAKIFKYVWKNRGKYADILKQYETEIRKLNPGLANVRVDDARSLVYGAMFGFAPKEIAYFSNGKNRDFEKEREITNVLKNRFGINLGYILAPETAKQVINALEQHEQVKAKVR